MYDDGDKVDLDEGEINAALALHQNLFPDKKLAFLSRVGEGAQYHFPTSSIARKGWRVCQVGYASRLLLVLNS